VGAGVQRRSGEEKRKIEGSRAGGGFVIMLLPRVGKTVRAKKFRLCFAAFRCRKFARKDRGGFFPSGKWHPVLKL